MVSHMHMIIRAEVENPLTDESETVEWLRELVNILNMNIMPNGGPYANYVNQEGNYGITGMVMIETSHISIHCWDKTDPKLAQIDVYSCKKFNKDDVISHMHIMRPIKIHYMIIDRENNIKLQEVNLM